MDDLPQQLLCSGWFCDYGLVSLPRLVVEFLGFPHSRASVNYLSNCPNHRHGMLGLPDVPSHVNPHSSFFNCVAGELKRVQLCLEFWSSSHNQRHRTTLDDFSKVLAVVRLDKLGTEFRGDS